MAVIATSASSVYSYVLSVRAVLLLQTFLAREGYNVARVDGKATHKQRQAELRRFASKEPGSPQVRGSSEWRVKLNLQLVCIPCCD